MGNLKKKKVEQKVEELNLQNLSFEEQESEFKTTKKGWLIGTLMDDKRVALIFADTFYVLDPTLPVNSSMLELISFIQNDCK